MAAPECMMNLLQIMCTLQPDNPACPPNLPPYKDAKTTLSMYLASGHVANEYGKYGTCSDIDAAAYCVLSDDDGLIRQGVCAPSVCEDDHTSLLAYYNAPMASMNIAYTGATCGSHSEDGYDTLAVCGIVFFFIVASLVTLATLFDAFPDFAKLFKCERSSDPAILELSLIRNFGRLTAPARAGRYDCLNGIRVISNFWVVLVHAQNYSWSVGYQNVMDVVPPEGVYSKWYFQPVAAGNLSVDSFFFVGGFLNAMSLTKQLSKGMPSWTKYVTHRLVRICPPYLGAFIFFVCLLPKLASGPYWYKTTDEADKCHTDWFYNLLFINNWFQGSSSGTECFDHSWYLANDFQFYLVSPLIVLVFVRFSRTVFYGLACALLAGTFSAAAATMSVYELSPSTFEMSGTEYSNMAYKKPYIRIQSYLLGMITYFITVDIDATISAKQVNDMQEAPFEPKGASKASNGTSGFSLDALGVGTRTKVAMLVCGFGLMLTAAFGTYSLYQDLEPDWSQSRKVTFETFWHATWTIGVALFAMLCFYGHGGCLNDFLASPAWMPFLRLSYCLYLVHPLVIFTVYYSQEQPQIFTHWGYLCSFAGVLLMSAVAAFPLYLCLEAPAGPLEAKFWKHMNARNRRPEESNAQVTQHLLAEENGAANSSRPYHPPTQV
eukprot:TRINITY_DN2325_c0_g1::TRINITY_DN2325_c0_g1_i1::g.20929::m.20929 TRINITY_DN2325_c0_g1::TRINITY_DN2325_c0_g1_i1::g.20929  ORF type:complete len:661 (+),score=170.30,sp/Q09225/NRF6_CAEEL/24.35/2e-38,Acyl_transf_3/PF01757.17/3.9e+03,Acyl_transf_3/PF01757.17/1.6e-20,CopD/PF05425.8/4.5e+03,CopD/PF05425.8/3.6e+02,CopD/PF05425.8/0.48,CopD/PF05425.8/7.9e+03 TRINITY_DN2325_c0_g1_i1:99-2081(+)